MNDVPDVTVRLIVENQDILIVSTSGDATETALEVARAAGEIEHVEVDDLMSSSYIEPGRPAEADTIGDTGLFKYRAYTREGVNAAIFANGLEAQIEQALQAKGINAAVVYERPTDAG